MRRILLVVQGPLFVDVNGYSTVDALSALRASPLRDRFHVLLAVWSDTDPELLATVAPYAEQVVRCEKPVRPGSGNRELLRAGMSQALDAVAADGFRHVLKSRTDFRLSDRFLQTVVSLADAGFERVLASNVYTRYEPFHVTDMLLFSTFENMRHWFDPRPVYYEDAFSPEVQCTRVFVRNKALPYSMRLEDYLRFLRDWIELIDFADEGLVWFKHLHVSRRLENRTNPILRDRDGGPLLGRLVSVRFVKFLRESRISPSLVATVMLMVDPMARVGVLGLSWTLEHVLRVRPRYFEIPLPRGYVAEVKLGLAPRRHAYYTVAPEGAEHTRPLGGAAPAAGRPRDHGSVTKGKPGLFSFALRRRARAVSATPEPR